MHDTIHLRLAVLGPIRLDGAVGAAPPSDRAHKLTELLAWLALHPDGAYGCEIDRDLVLSPQSRMAGISRLRGWLGRSALPVTHGGRRYRLHVTTDWSRVQSLLCDRDGGLRRDTSTAALMAALRLVRGVPLADVGAPWADGPRLQMVLLCAMPHTHSSVSQ